MAAGAIGAIGAGELSQFLRNGLRVCMRETGELAVTDQTTKNEEFLVRKRRDEENQRVSGSTIHLDPISAGKAYFPGSYDVSQASPKILQLLSSS